MKGKQTSLLEQSASSDTWDRSFFGPRAPYIRDQSKLTTLPPRAHAGNGEKNPDVNSIIRMLKNTSSEAMAGRRWRCQRCFRPPLGGTPVVTCAGASRHATRSLPRCLIQESFKVESNSRAAARAGSDMLQRR